MEQLKIRKFAEAETAMSIFASAQAHVYADEGDSHNDECHTGEQKNNQHFQDRNLEIWHARLWFNVWYGI
jgi:hypothetical protein